MCETNDAMLLEAADPEMRKLYPPQVDAASFRHTV